jgi:hypothetical protein
VSRTITGRGRGHWNAEERWGRGKEVRLQGKAQGRLLIRGWQPWYYCAGNMGRVPSLPELDIESTYPQNSSSGGMVHLGPRVAQRTEIYLYRVNYSNQ